MASDTPDSKRKHRRSSDDDADDSSKRRKHRHHHHHRRHRHSSRKHEAEGEGKHEAEGDGKHAAEDFVALPSPQPAATVVAVVSGSNWRPDYDMEEGEIVEEEGFGAGGDAIEKKKSDSDVESGEIKALEVRDVSDVQNLDGHMANGDQQEFCAMANSRGKVARNLNTLQEYRSDDDLVTDSDLVNETGKSDYEAKIVNKIHGEDGLSRHSSAKHYEELFSSGSPDGDMNRDAHHESHRKNNSGCESPVKGYGKTESYYEVDKSELQNQRKSLSSESAGDKYKKLAHSPTHDRYRDKVHMRGRSRSHDHARERSRSQSILQDVALSKATHHQEWNASSYAGNRRTDNDTDEEMALRRRDYRHPSRDLVRDEERERSSSHSRQTQRGDKHQSRETWDMAKAGREMDWERQREREQDRSRERERERERNWERDRKREKERDRSMDREMDRNRKREKDMGTDRDMDRGRKQERERDRSWDRDRARERDRNRNRDIDRENDRDRARDRKSERGSGRDRSRDKVRDSESDRVSRHHKSETLNDGYGNRDRYGDSWYLRHDETEHQRHRTRKNDEEKGLSSKNDSLEGNGDKLNRDEDEHEDYQERVTLQLAEKEEEEFNRIKEESRRRRQAILEKYKSQHSQQQLASHTEDTGKDKESVEQPSETIVAETMVPEVPDGKNDGTDTYDADPSFSVGKSPPQNGLSASERTSGAGGLGEGTPKSERPDDMFCDDIFGESPAGVRKSGRGDGLLIERSGLHDNWDDAEGYYSHRFGEILDGRYEITAAHGKGVFSTVVRAKDLKAGNGEPEEVAIKIIRNNDTMYKAGLEELVILKKLVGADPDDKRHCVRFLSSFKYRNHLCLVFESLHMNLREVLKKFGRNIGLKLTAVRAYAKQLFIALKHLRNCGVLHCDIKPDNMLVNEAKNVLKLCDFGNAMFSGKNEITPYLVSRFYRAPEIILGLSYDHPMDIWSVGCCLYELYTGKVLFPGPSNNDMLRLHMELKGPFPKKMLRKGAFTDQHFDQDLNFHATEEDPVTKKTIKRLIMNIRPKDIGAIISSSPGEDPKMAVNFKDLLEKIFVLDPEKRMTVSQALCHPFITGK